MKCFLQYRSVAILGFILAFTISKAYSQVTVTSSDSVNCTNTCTTLTAHLIGDEPIASGITQDDVYPPTASPIGFTFNFYGNNYTSCLIGANGNICFTASSAGGYDAYEITGNLASAGESALDNCIAGPYCDIDIAQPNGGTITYSTDGVAPNRKFVITFCRTLMYNTSFCPGQYTTTQIILYETTNIVEVHIANKTVCNAWNGGHAIVGVKNLAGTNSLAAPGRDYPTQWTAIDEAWRFTPVGTGTSYTVSSIPYAPVPYETSLIYWYNAATNAYIDTGTSITVCPTDTTTYKAAALGCSSDTSFGYYTVVPTGQFHISTLHSDPSQCGICNGSITLHGVFPSTLDTVFYEIGGVAQTPLTFIAGTDSNITLTPLCAGIYSNIYVKTGFCISDTVADTLITPSLYINATTFTNPHNCDTCDGTLTLHGLIPGEPDTINYSINGTAQPTVVGTAGPDGTYTFTKLCPGIYSDITYSIYGCVSNMAGPDTIMVPPLIVDSMSFSNPSYCGACNGTIYLHGLIPGMKDTVIIYSYYNPVTQAVDTITGGSYVIGADSSILLTNLCAGIYGDIVVQSGLCVSPGYGPITIQDPALYIANVQTTNPDGCNVCDGVIQLSSVPENQYDTVKYQYNGVWLNPPVVFPTNPNHTITLVNLCAGAYDSIIVSNKFGCVSNVLSDSLSGPVIQASFAYMVHPGCGGQDTVYFTNTSNPINDYTRWHFGDGTTDTVANPVHSYATGNTYNVTLYTSNLPCIDSITIPITLSHPLSAMFTSIPGDTLCQGQQITFTNTSAGGITSWLWNLGDGTIDSTDMNPPVHVYNNTGVYQVSLVVKDTIPCYDTAKATVYVDSNSAVSFKLSDSSICAGQQVIFTATYTRIGSEGINWNFGDGFTAGDINPVTHTYTSVMDSTVVTLNAGYRACPDTSAKKTVYIRPYPLLNLGGDTSLCPGSTPIALSDNINISTPGTKWVWNTGDTTAGIVVTVPGLYYVTVTEDGCSNRDSVWVKKDCYIDIPNVFTPNNDGVNDYFFPRNLLTSGVTEFKMEIYNRWGQQIFETGNTDGQGWDGKFNGTDQPEGVYVYIIDVSFKNGKKEHHQGNVTLLR